MILPLAILLCSVAAVSPWWLRDRQTRRRLVTLPDGARDGGGPTGSGIEIPVVLELLAAAISSGASIPRALEAVGKAVGGREGAAMARAASALVMGASWRGAWMDCPARLDVIHRALGPSWEYGAAPVESLKAAATQLHQERTARTKKAAASLGVRLVLPLGMCFLPAFILMGLLPVLISLGSGLLGR